jgi:osmotically-inducible protein OsmY
MRRVAIVACVVLVGCSRNDKPATTEITSAPVEARPSDEELIRRVEGAISARPQISMAAKNAEVDAVDGAIILRGSVSDPFVKNDIEKLAASVPGVKTTLNKLDVRGTTEPESDDTIAFSIQRALVTDPTIASEADRVTIDVNGGIVTLRGRASSPEGKMAVERVVERTPGVVTVMNNLRVPGQRDRD